MYYILYIEYPRFSAIILDLISLCSSFLLLKLTPKFFKCSTCSNVYSSMEIFCKTIGRLLMIYIYLVLLSFILRPIIILDLTTLLLISSTSYLKSSRITVLLEYATNIPYHLTPFLRFHAYLSLPPLSNAIFKIIIDSPSHCLKLDFLGNPRLPF